MQSPEVDKKAAGDGGRWARDGQLGQSRYTVKVKVA